MRFLRFALAAIAAVITSQVVLGLLTGPVNLTRERPALSPRWWRLW